MSNEPDDIIAALVRSLKQIPAQMSEWQNEDIEHHRRIVEEALRMRSRHE